MLSSKKSIPTPTKTASSSSLLSTKSSSSSLNYPTKNYKNITSKIDTNRFGKKNATVNEPVVQKPQQLPKPMFVAPCKRTVLVNTEHGITTKSTATLPTQSTVQQPANKGKISDRLNAKVIGPFGSVTHKTAFSAVYQKGGIPCRLVHGSVKSKLNWTEPIHTIPYDTLAIFFEGLLETRHPFTFIVRQGIKDLLFDSHPSTIHKVANVLPKLMPSLRMALMSREKETVVAAFEVVKDLAKLLGPYFLNSLANGGILPPIASKALQREFREVVMECLQVIEEFAGGEEAYKVIKQKVPTYNSICFV